MICPEITEGDLQNNKNKRGGTELGYHYTDEGRKILNNDDD